MTLVVLSTLAVVATATPAAADTSQASAEAASLSLGGDPVITTDAATASNDGEVETTGGTHPPALAILGQQDVLNASLLAQDAQANDDGTSQACAGAVGEGGLIQVGQPGECDVENGEPGGVVVDLLPGVQLRADAIYAECSAVAGETPTSQVTIVNLKVVSEVTGVPVELVNVPLYAEPNTQVINVPGVATITLNDQPVPQEFRRVQATALRVTVLGEDGIDLRIGTVSCGRNLTTAEIPTFVAEGLPFALAVVGVLGLGAYAVLRRRNQPGIAA